MAITLMPLPYAEGALSPHISAETIATHHGKHHKAYVDKVNEAVEGTPLAAARLEEIVNATKDDDRALFNNAGQAWNHGFYWHSLSPQPGAPSAELAAAIRRDFGSLDALIEALAAEAVGHFASGWAWLVARGGKLEVLSTHDGDTVLTLPVVPLLTIDVWEHAYYLDVKNRRPDYVEAVVGKCLNWRFASENYVRGAVWTYPQRVLENQP